MSRQIIFTIIWCANTRATVSFSPWKYINKTKVKKADVYPFHFTIFFENIWSFRILLFAISAQFRLWPDIFPMDFVEFHFLRKYLHKNNINWQLSEPSLFFSSEKHLKFLDIFICNFNSVFLFVTFSQWTSNEYKSNTSLDMSRSHFQHQHIYSYHQLPFY